MPLTELKLKNAKTKEKDYKLSDEKGLYLLMRKNGAKYWRLKYRFAGKEKTLSLGVYPEISLKQARQGREEARLLLRDEKDPSQVKQQKRIDLKNAHRNTFKGIAQDWHQTKLSEWTEKTAKKNLWILEKKLYPSLGSTPIKNLLPQTFIATLKKIQSKGTTETAHRAKQVAGQVCRYAVSMGLIPTDPTRDIKDVLSTTKVTHRASITDPVHVGKLMRDIDSYEGTPVVQALLSITPLVFQRPGEIRQMEWSEIDFDKFLWEVPGEKMKMGKAHIVPLSEQAMIILNEIKPLTSWGEYVFPNARKRRTPASDGTVNKALRKMGYSKDDMTAHGFRAMARTMLDEILEYEPYIIDQQLSHAVRDPNGRAYNRTSHLKQRQQMMQAWADYLDKLKQGAEIISLVAKGGKP